MANETSSQVTDPEVLASVEHASWAGGPPPEEGVSIEVGPRSHPAVHRLPEPRPVVPPGRRTFDADAAQKLADAYTAHRDSEEGPELRAALILELTPLVESVARKFAGCAEPVED